MFKNEKQFIKKILHAEEILIPFILVLSGYNKKNKKNHYNEYFEGIIKNIKVTQQLANQVIHKRHREQGIN